MAQHRAANRTGLFDPFVRRTVNPRHVPRHAAYDHDDEADALIVLVVRDDRGDVVKIGE